MSVDDPSWVVAVALTVVGVVGGVAGGVAMTSIVADPRPAHVTTGPTGPHTHPRCWPWVGTSVRVPVRMSKTTVVVPLAGTVT